jgi:hypothetical protein
VVDDLDERWASKTSDQAKLDAKREARRAAAKKAAATTAKRKKFGGCKKGSLNKRTPGRDMEDAWHPKKIRLVAAGRSRARGQGRA